MVRACFVSSKPKSIPPTPAKKEATEYIYNILSCLMNKILSLLYNKLNKKAARRKYNRGKNGCIPILSTVIME